MFDVVDTCTAVRYVMKENCSFLQDFSKGKGSSLHVHVVMLHFLHGGSCVHVIVMNRTMQQRRTHKSVTGHIDARESHSQVKGNRNIDVLH